MQLLTIVKNIYRKISHLGGVTYSHTVEKDEEFLNSFIEPQTDVERSYFQYKCQLWNDKRIIKRIISSIASFFLIIPYRILFRMKAKKCFFSGSNRDVITARYVMNYLNYDTNYGYNLPAVIENDTGILTREDILWLKCISVFKYGFFFYFKIMCRVALYSKAIKIYDPKTIYSSAEYSFTSSVLTDYCEARGINHINIMHGEKIFDLTDAFSRFTKFYVWDEGYIMLFNRLRANKTCYLVFPRKPFKLDKCNNGTCTYYLQSETYEQLTIIRSCLDKLHQRYKVRPHPVYWNNAIMKVFGLEVIEDWKHVSIEESLNNTEYAISVNSTVLFEAYLAGRRIVIDDISNKKLFNELSSRDYIMMHKKHILLSAMIKARNWKEAEKQ